MAINIEVAKGGNENSMSLIRRFTKRTQGSGVVRKAKSLRYYDRIPSRNVRRKQALISIGRRDKYQEDVKLGKVESNGRGQ